MTATNGVKADDQTTTTTAPTTMTLTENNNMAKLEETCVCNRWYVSLEHTMKADNFERLFKKGIQALTPGEYAKVPTFRHKEDTLACLTGRLLLRYATQSFTGEPWELIEFERTEKGKPYVVRPENTNFGLNVSHQGDLIAFASSCSSQVGVDVMRLDKERVGKTADQYIDSMAKSASKHEYQSMKQQPTEAMKMTMFYRYWCLKEAIVKATGEGIRNNLAEIDFRIDQNDKYKPGCFVTSTAVHDNGVEQTQWIFEETFVGHNHSAAVCREKKLPRTCAFKRDPDARKFFQRVNFEELLKHSVVLNPLPFDGRVEYEDFLSKPNKKF